MAKLTVIELKAYSAADIGKRVSDDGSLWGRVRASSRNNSGVAIAFWYRFKRDGKTRDLSCGTWPKDSLVEIRRKRDEARTLCSSGLDPVEQRKISRIEQQEAVSSKLAEIERQKAESLSVNDLFEEWMAHGVRRNDGNHELRRSFNADVLPNIGSKQIKNLSVQDLRGVLRALVDRRVNRAAVVMANNLIQMFRWAEKQPVWRKLMVDGNPASLIEIEKIVSPDYDMSNERDRILAPSEICELRDKLAAMQDKFNNAPNKRVVSRPISETTEIALWLMLSTMCRVGELSMARWDHVDFNSGEWFIPRSNVKGNVSDMKIYLSDFSLHQFRRLHSLTKHSSWCFPAANSDSHVCVKSISKQVGDRQIMFKHDKAGAPRKPMMNRSKDGNALVLSNGKNGAWTPHDLRRTGATLMQSAGVSLDVIDRCQNHVLAGSKIRRHYMHHDYAKEKKEAWQVLANRLSSILETQNLVMD
ncbi:tyrosine-type recombinase/integrase [Noviherbaspirillum sp.]|uniref:tyrosine-type recombinase/integrase n=1 Tax=Noviherbaspirillum sp. TaxID=1926288 RepID=UPI002FE34C55